MLTCATCGKDEPEGSQFCGDCGASLVPADHDPARKEAEASTPLICASCGNEEPQGSQFCGECGAHFAPLDQEIADAAALAAPALNRRQAHGAQQPVEEAAQPDARPTPPPRGRRSLRWVAAGAVVALLAAGGGVAAVLSLTGGDDSTEATPTEEPVLAETTESVPPALSPPLADSFRPRLVELALSQRAVTTRVRSLQAGVQSFAALRQAGDALAATVVGTQGFVDALVPASSTETTARSLLQGALVAHLAYAEAISGLPPRPRSFTRTQAQDLVARAERVQVAYSTLADAEPALSGVALNSFDHERLLELVPSSQPPRSVTTRRTIDLAPLLVGIRPDDPLGEGRCFGAYTSRASLSVSGVVHRSGFVQCGDDSNGDPGRASGIYRFSGRGFAAGSRPVRLTAQAAIDESSSSSQRGTSVTWTVLYSGEPICSRTVTWTTSRPSPRKLDCRFPPPLVSRGLDLQRLRVQQVAFPASSGALWAGLLDPAIVLEVRK